MANECLEILGAKDTKSWPLIDKKLILKEKIKMVIQINGKTRDVFELEKGVKQIDVEKICKKNVKIKDNFKNKSIKKVIFVKDRIINFII